MPSKKKLKTYFKKLSMPPRQRKEESGPTTPGECEWQGDNWRKNNKWGAGSKENATPPGTPLSQDNSNNLKEISQMSDQAMQEVPSVMEMNNHDDHNDGQVVPDHTAPLERYDVNKLNIPDNMPQGSSGSSTPEWGTPPQDSMNAMEPMEIQKHEQYKDANFDSIDSNKQNTMEPMELQKPQQNQNTEDQQIDSHKQESSETESSNTTELNSEEQYKLLLEAAALAEKEMEADEFADEITRMERNIKKAKTKKKEEEEEEGETIHVTSSYLPPVENVPKPDVKTKMSFMSILRGITGEPEKEEKKAKIERPKQRLICNIVQPEIPLPLISMKDIHRQVNEDLANANKDKNENENESEIKTEIENEQPPPVRRRVRPKPESSDEGEATPSNLMKSSFMSMLKGIPGNEEDDTQGDAAMDTQPTDEIPTHRVRRRNRDEGENNDAAQTQTKAQSETEPEMVIPKENAGRPSNLVKSSFMDMLKGIPGKDDTAMDTQPSRIRRRIREDDSAQKEIEPEPEFVIPEGVELEEDDDYASEIGRLERNIIQQKVKSLFSREEEVKEVEEDEFADDIARLEQKLTFKRIKSILTPEEEELPDFGLELERLERQISGKEMRPSYAPALVEPPPPPPPAVIPPPPPPAPPAVIPPPPPPPPSMIPPPPPPPPAMKRAVEDNLEETNAENSTEDKMEIENHWALWEKEQREEYERELAQRKENGEDDQSQDGQKSNKWAKWEQNAKENFFLDQERINFKKQRLNNPTEDDDEDLPDFLESGEGMEWLNEFIDPQDLTDASMPSFRPSINRMKNFWEAEKSNRGELSVDDWTEKSVTFPTQSRRRQGPEVESAPAFVMPKLKPVAAVPPPPPPPPGMIPPPPPSVGLVKPSSLITDKKKAHLEAIRKASRSRPDWRSIMSEVKGGIKLRHINTEVRSDRSQPMLPATRGKGGKFVYESEKSIPATKLIGEIHRGVQLRKTQTNDRSKPDFRKLGIKKLRRQQIEDAHKVSKYKINPKGKAHSLPSSSDEEEDIDKMRDDLASTKLQLTQEIQNNKKMERDHKILHIDMDGYQAEIKVLKRKLRDAGYSEPKALINCDTENLAPKLSKSMSKLKMGEEDGLDFDELGEIEAEIKGLQDQIYAHRQRADTADQKNEEFTHKLELARSEIEEWEARCNYFEKKFRQAQSGQQIELPDVDCHGTQTSSEDFAELYRLMEEPDAPKRSGSRRFSQQISRMESFREEDEGEEGEGEEGEGEEEYEESETEEETETETETEDENCEEEEEDQSEEVAGEDYDEEAREAREREKEAKRQQKEIDLWKTKVLRMKEKEDKVMEERTELREKITALHNDSLTERRQYLDVKKQVDELLSTISDLNGDEDDDDDGDDDDDANGNADDDSGWWLNDDDDKPKPKPKKLKKKKKKYLTDDGRLVVEEDDEDLQNLTALEPPVWFESEDEESDDDNEEAEYGDRLIALQMRLQSHEMVMGGTKKSNYLLKDQLKRCTDMFEKEERRHKRLNEEFQKLLIDMEEVN